jgi:hypothetical protein
VVLLAAEVAGLIEAVEDQVHRTVLASIHAAGLRAAEVLAPYRDIEGAHA